ncbi:MAG: ferredoxin--NADP reductase, partial [Pseudomonadota bacterium]
MSLDTQSGPVHYPLTVARKQAETDQSASFVLVPRPEDAPLFAYEPGQFLTFAIPHGTGRLQRSYSLSSAPGFDPLMSICVKRVAGGRGSNWMLDHLHAGDAIDVQPPAGRFTLKPGPAPLYVIAGGSGITPCLSLIKSALTHTDRSLHLLYANQHRQAVIYEGILADLERRHPGRFTLRHWLDEAHGRLTAADFLDMPMGPDPHCYICGPAPMMDMAEAVLADRFGDAVVMTERFASPDDDVVETETAGPADAAPETFRLTLDGVDHVVPLQPGQTLLSAALEMGLDAPMSCTEGHCGACMGQLKEGEVQMASTKALSKRNIARGYVLACQAKPVTAAPLWLDFD